MLDKLKKNKLYIKYGVLIIFIAVVVVLTVKTITYGEDIINWISIQFKFFINIISPIIYALLISYLLYQPVRFIEKRIISGVKIWRKKGFNGSILTRLASVVIVAIFLILFLVLIYNYLIPPILRNVREVINSLPEFQESMKVWVNEIVQSLNNKNIDVNNTGELSKEIVDKLGSIAQNVFNYIGIFISNLSSFILDFVVTIILTLYFLIDKERLMGQMRKIRDVLFTERGGNILNTFFTDLDNIVGKFIVAELLDSIIVGIVSTVLLLLIKHPFAVLIGVIAGATNIIPYIGPVIGAALAFFLGIFTSLPLGITGAVLLLLYQQVDGNFVQPKIVGDKIGLSPVWILMVVLIGGSYFGALGMILSMPFAGLIRVYFNRYAERKKNKEEIKDYEQ